MQNFDHNATKFSAKNALLLAQLCNLAYGTEAEARSLTGQMGFPDFEWVDLEQPLENTSALIVGCDDFAAIAAPVSQEVMQIGVVRLRIRPHPRHHIGDARILPQQGKRPDTAWQLGHPSESDRKRLAHRHLSPEPRHRLLVGRGVACNPGQGGRVLAGREHFRAGPSHRAALKF